MNVLSRDQKIQIVAALTEGMSIRAIERLTGIHRDTIMRLGAKVGRGCAALHDGMFVGIRTGRLELDELWAYVGRKRRQNQKPGADGPVTGDQYTYVALASSSRAIISYLTGKRSSNNTDDFIGDIRSRVIGAPEISTDGYHPYKSAIRDAFVGRAAHGTITKTYSVTHLNVKEASRRYSPAAVIAVEREVVNGVPAQISTSYVERSHLTMRMSCKRFARLGNGFSKKIDNHTAAVSLHVAFYNLCRVHESLRTTPAVACGMADRVWTIARPTLSGHGLRMIKKARVPDAVQHEVMRRRSGTVPHTSVSCGPGSAAQHCMLRCARDTGAKPSQAPPAAPCGQPPA